jgi:hypothetical protein
MEAFPACKVILFATNIGKASKCLKGYDFPLLKRPQVQVTVPTLVSYVAIVSNGMES